MKATTTALLALEKDTPQLVFFPRLENRKHLVARLERRRAVGDLELAVALPPGSRVISFGRNGKAEAPDGSMELEPGDALLVILEPGKEDELRRVLLHD